VRFEHAVCLLVAASPLSKPITNIALALCAVLFVRDWRAGRLRPRATPLDGAILAWLAANALSALASIDPLQSFRDLRNIGHWSAYYFVVWAAASGTMMQLIQDAWLGGAALTAAVALVQGALHVDPLGRTLNVPTGFFGGHLELGHYMVLTFALAMARWSDARAATERQLTFTAMVAFGAALVVSGGRGPWLAFLAVAACWGGIAKRKRVVVAVAVVLAIQFAFLAFREEGPAVFYRSYVIIEKDAPTPVADTQIASNAWRVAMWREGLRFFALRPVTGTGVETTRSLSRDFRTPFPDLAVAHLHSNYFEILMTRGFLGLTTFLWILLAAARRLSRALADAPPGPTRAALFAGLAAVVVHLVHGLTHFTVGSSWIQIGFYIGLGLGIGELIRTQGSSVSGGVDSRSCLQAASIGALTIVAAPPLAVHPVVAGCAALVALIDCGARLAIGRYDDAELAVAAAMAFTAAAAFVLLVIDPQTHALGVRVLTAAAAPFVLVQASRRTWSLAADDTRP